MSTDELHNPEKYILLEQVNYHDMLPFLLPLLKPREPVMWFFYGFVLISFLLTIGLAVFGMVISQGSFGKLLFCVGFSWVFVIALIPIHEMLHGLVFKILGAGKLTFGANFRNFMFYVTSHEFILSKKQFCILALAPFIIISLVSIGFIFHSDFWIQFVAANVLFAHSTCCVGDFALMSFFHLNDRHNDCYTYDDVNSMTSYFFKRKL